MDARAPTQDSPQTANPNAVNPLDVVRLLRSAGAALVAQASLHGQLACVEWAEEKARLKNMLLLALTGFAFLLCFLLFAGVLVVALTWDTPYRVAGILAVTSVHAGAAFLAWKKFNALSALGSRAFAATREEIAADIALIKSKL